jgi:hypothetical protein
MSEEKLLALYKATQETAHIHWEWRHKVVTHFVVVAGATFAGFISLFNIECLRKVSWIPFAGGAAFSVICYAMDSVNTLVLRECYKQAGEMERTLRTEGGIYAAMNVLHYQKTTYASILRVFYLVCFELFVILAALAGFSVPAGDK